VITSVFAGHTSTAVEGERYNSPTSPDGRYIEALSADETIVFLFDFQTHKWTQLAKGGFAWPNFSKDSKYLYVLSGHGGSSVLKIRLSDGKAEQVGT
jgi:WD40 repeat protein